jgi:hypothetical protein
MWEAWAKIVGMVRLRSEWVERRVGELVTEDVVREGSRGGWRTYSRMRHLCSGLLVLLVSLL